MKRFSSINSRELNVTCLSLGRNDAMKEYYNGLTDFTEVVINIQENTNTLLTMLL